MSLKSDSDNGAFVSSPAVSRPAETANATSWRIATMSPAAALSANCFIAASSFVTVLRIPFSLMTTSSRRIRSKTVAQFGLPFGRPSGLPEVPLRNCVRFGGLPYPVSNVLDPFESTDLPFLDRWCEHVRKISGITEAFGSKKCHPLREEEEVLFSWALAVKTGIGRSFAEAEHEFRDGFGRINIGGHGHP